MMPKCHAQPNHTLTNATPPKITCNTTVKRRAQDDIMSSATPAGNSRNGTHSQTEARNSKEGCARAVALQYYINCMKEPDLIILDNHQIGVSESTSVIPAAIMTS